MFHSCNFVPPSFVTQGLAWYEFLAQFDERRASSVVSGHRLSQPTSEIADSRRSSAQSTANASARGSLVTNNNNIEKTETKDLRRQALQRHQTFDSTASNDAEDGLLAASAHSTRSHSCIAPVDISIRRLSGGINLVEESSIDLVDDSKAGTSPPAFSVTNKLPSPSSPSRTNLTFGLHEETILEQSASEPGVKIIKENDEDLLTSDIPGQSSASLPPLPPGHVHQGPHPQAGSAVITAAVAAAMTAGSVVSSARSSFAISRSEQKRREALWDLFQSECNFLYDHLMVLKNVFMEPLKKIQVEGFAMFAEPEMLFGNLDELCCVTYAFCKEFLSVILNQMNFFEVNATEALVKLFQKVMSWEFFLWVFVSHLCHTNSKYRDSCVEYICQNLEFLSTEK